MKFSITEQEKGDLLIQVTAWTGLTVQDSIIDPNPVRDVI